MKKGIILTVKCIALSLSMGMFLASCGSGPQEVEKITFLEKRTFTGEDSLIDKYPRIKGDAHSGSWMSRSDTTSPYGFGNDLIIADSLLNKDLRVKVNFWAKTNELGEGYTYAVSVSAGDQMVSWNTIDLKKYITQPNIWTNINDSITIPGNILNQSGLVLKAFTFVPNNAKRSIVLDADDMEISFYKVEKEVKE